MEPDDKPPGQRLWSGRVGSRHRSVCQTRFDPVLSFNMRIYRTELFLQSNTISAN